MKPHKIITLLFVAILPLIATAQNQPQIKIGTKGIPHGVNETGVAETISVASFAKDGTLHVTKDNKVYTIESFEISILPKKGNDLIGPLVLNATRGNGNISDLKNMPEIKNYKSDGTRIFIERLTASCADCTDMNTITVKAFSINLKE
ncbi:MAG: hypothetical protein R2800_07035 [Flavipsychrobacter sp.]